MQETCHRCGGELQAGSGESPFCPHCGAPQLFLSLENQSVEAGGEPSGGMANAIGETTNTAPPPRPRQVEWKTAIRCAALVAGVGSALALGSVRVSLLSTLSLMWFMSASLITLGIYQKRLPAAWMDVRVGTKIGVVVGICLALGLGLAIAGAGLIARFWLHGMGSFDSEMAARIQEAIRNSTTPVPAEMLGFLASPEFRAGMMVVGFAFLSAILMVLSILGGAFAGFLRTRRGSAV
jgi:hypothetical protein